MHSNRLTRIPDLTTNTKLTTLSASNNRLSSWPRSLERLTRLKVLRLQSNRLTNIPASVDRLPRLKYLDVSNNTITSLDTLTATTAGEGGAAQNGRNETMLLLGRNPVCANGGTSSGALGSKWFVSCQSQCSSTCSWYISWKPAGVTDHRGNGWCDIACNTTACSFDGGSCLK